MPDPEDADEYDVFLSHSSPDKPAVEVIAGRLQAQGLRPFLDKWHLIPGEPWQEALEEALDRSATCAVFVGPGEIRPWENEEMRAALEERVGNRSFRVIPVLLPGAEVGEQSHLPRFLRRMTWVDFRDAGIEDDEALRRLVAGIRGVAPGPSGSGTGPSGRVAVSADRGQASIDHALVRLGTKPNAWKREALIEEAVRRLHAAPVAVPLQGLPGMGKTTLMGQTADRLRDEFPFALTLVFAGPAASEPAYALEEINASLTSLGRGLDPRRLYEQDRGRTLETLLSQLIGVRLLVLLDDLDRAPAAWQGSLVGGLASVGSVRVVATAETRPPGARSMNPLPVPPLTLAEATAFVRDYTSTFDLQEDPEEIVAQLPASITSHPEALATVLGHLRDLPLDLLLAEGIPEDARAPGMVVRKAIQALEEPERRALSLVEVLSGLDLAEAMATLQLPMPPGFGSSLETLLSRSLIDRAGRTWTVPTLVAEGLAAVDEPGRAAAAREVAGHLQRLAGEAGGGDRDVDDLAGLAPAVGAHLAASHHWPLLAGFTQSAFLEILNVRGYWKEYAALLRFARAAATETGDRAALLEADFRLARKLPQMGDPAGGREALAEVERQIGPDGETPDHASLHSHRAYLAGVEGDEGQARDELLRSRAIREALGDLEGIAVVDKLLGNADLRQGDIPGARAAYESALASPGLPADSKHRVDVETNLGLCDLEESRLDEAEARLRKALARCEELDYRAGVPLAQLVLAQVLEAMDRSDEALAMAREAAEGAEDESPQVARTAGMIARRLERRLGAGGDLDG